MLGVVSSSSPDGSSACVVHRGALERSLLQVLAATLEAWTASSLRLDWTAPVTKPEGNNGAPIEGYRVQLATRRAAVQTVGVAITDATVTGSFALALGGRLAFYASSSLPARRERAGTIVAVRPDGNYDVRVDGSEADGNTYTSAAGADLLDVYADRVPIAGSHSRSRSRSQSHSPTRSQARAQ